MSKARRRNPRGGSLLGTALAYGAVGGAGWVAYNFALDGKLGETAAKLALQIQELLGGRPGSPAGHISPRSLPGQGGAQWPLTLYDSAGACLSYDVWQDALVGGGRTYRAGSEVYDSAGVRYQVRGDGQIYAPDVDATMDVRLFVPGE